MSSAVDVDQKIVIDALAKNYHGHGGERRVLAGVELAVRDGEFLSIVGHSGAGKTTLLRCIAGLEPPSSGGVRFDGELVTGPPPNLALIFQDYGRVALPLAAGARQRDAPAAQVPARSRTGSGGRPRSTRWPPSGSPTRRRSTPGSSRAGCNSAWRSPRAIACRPQVLLMDEPFASVDAQTRADLEDLVLGIRRQFGMTVVLVTHDVDESVYMSDRIAVLGGTPTGVTQLIDVDLPPGRDQLTTKSLPRFIDLRARVLRAVRALSAERKSGA